MVKSIKIEREIEFVKDSTAPVPMNRNQPSNRGTTDAMAVGIIVAIGLAVLAVVIAIVVGANAS